MCGKACVPSAVAAQRRDQLVLPEATEGQNTPGNVLEGTSFMLRLER